MTPNPMWTRLEAVLREIGLDRIFGQDPGFLERRINEVCRAYAAHAAHAAGFGGIPPAPTVENLVEEYQRNPHRVQTLMQAIAFVCTPEMVSMMWLVLNGARIASINYSYSRADTSELQVEVATADGTRTERFRSDDIWDAAVLKLAALSKADDRPLIESFYPLFIPPRDPGGEVQRRLRAELLTPTIWKGGTMTAGVRLWTIERLPKDCEVLEWTFTPALEGIRLSSSEMARRPIPLSPAGRTDLGEFVVKVPEQLPRRTDGTISVGGELFCLLRVPHRQRDERWTTGVEAVWASIKQ